MKLPKFKLPKFKLPKFGKGNDEDEDDDEFEGFDEDFDPDVFSGETGDGADALAAEEAKAARAAASGENGAGDDDAPPSPASEVMEGPGDDAPRSPAASIMPEGEFEPSHDDMPTPSSHRDDDMPDFGDDDDEDDDEEGGGFLSDPDKRKMLIMAAAGAVLLLGLGGGAWWFFSGDDGEDVNIAAQEGEGGLTPPGAEGADGEASADGEAPAESEQKSDVNSLNAIGQRDEAATPGLGLSIEPMTNEVFASLVAAQGKTPLTEAPDPALAEQSAHGMLPKVGADGRKPWQVYAKPASPKAADLPKIAVVVRGLGLSPAGTEAAISKLPSVVSFAFDPYVKNLAALARKARQNGHETLVSVPLESGVFPVIDPGSKALSTEATPQENAVILDGILASMAGYVGVLTTYGSKFNQSEHHVNLLLKSFKTRGLLIVDGGDAPKSDIPKLATEMGVPRVMVDMPRIEDPSVAGAMAYFAEAEAMAKRKSVAVVAIEPYPAVFNALVTWLADLEKKNIVVVPISAVADKQFLE